MHFFADDIFPQSIDRLHPGAFAGERGHVGHTRIKITSADRMADSFGLIDQRFVVLLIKTAQLVRVRAPTEVAKEPRLLEVLALAGGCLLYTSDAADERS